MKIQTRILLSAAASLAISLVIVLIVFSSLQDIDKEAARGRIYDEIRSKTDALNLSIARFERLPDASRIRQIREVRSSLEHLLGTMTSVDAREESLVRQIRKNSQELGYSLLKLISSSFEPGGAMEAERHDVLVSQLWMKTQFISDDTHRLMEFSQSRIAAARQHSEILTLALIVGLLFVNTAISFFTGRSIIRMQEGLRKQREWLQVTLASIGDAVIATDPESKIAFLNPGAALLTGWPIEEALGRSVQDIFRIINEKTREPAEDIVSRVLNEGSIVTLANHTALVARDGRETPIEDSAAPIRDEAGKVAGMVLVFHDVSEKRRAHDALQRSEGMLKAVLEQMPSGVTVRDAHSGKLILSNARSQEILGVLASTPDQFAQYRGFHPDGRAYRKEEWPGIRSVATGEVVFGEEIGCERRHGNHIMLSISSAPVRDPQGRIVMGVSVFDDITARRRAEDTLRRLNETLEQQVAARTALAESRAKQLQALAVELIEAEERERHRISVLLHDDLQQILASARMQLEAACRSMPKDPMLSYVEQLLSESIGKSRRLAHELSPPVLYHTSLVEALKWLARQMQEQFGLTVEIEEKANQPFENELLKVFMFRAVQELLFNVVKHAGVKSARILLSISLGCLDITVSDQGKGFNPGDLNSATTTAGLGLLSLRERAHYIGGSLRIESAPGRGSCFALTVPLNIAKADRLQRPAADRQPIAPAELACDIGPLDIRVLFVDDHKVMRQGLMRLMNGQPNLQVVGEAANGLEAIEQVRRLRPNVVVMDISMPEMDGIEATRRIKAEWPDVGVIGLSMFEDDQIAEKMRQAGAEAFVSKAASSAELLKAIYGIMHLEKRVPSSRT